VFFLLTLTYMDVGNPEVGEKRASRNSGLGRFLQADFWPQNNFRFARHSGGIVMALLAFAGSRLFFTTKKYSG
jgi:hypothetical protein